jgi:hypothetical protein
MNPQIQFKKSINLSLIVLLLACFALPHRAGAVGPAPDGGYPGGNTAEGTNALLSRTTGIYNTGIGIYALLSLTDGKFCTGVGAGTLLVNNADQNTATGAGALLSNTTGSLNTANGTFALFKNTTGSFNVANGQEALFSNTTGNDNTAVGLNALFSNTTGSFNTALGRVAMGGNTTGINNTGIGWFALAANTTGVNDTAVGYNALTNDTSTGSNTAVGSDALFNNTTGADNTAIGGGALLNNTTGNSNIALGDGAGLGVTTASNVIAIGARGADLGNSCYVGNIFGEPVDPATAIPVFVDTTGKLGTAFSSRRFKHDIKPMDKASEAILALKPVTFHYKSDNTNTPQFGLVAEDVEKVNPDLVVLDKEGKPYAVRYDQVNAMLLNEFLKEHEKTEKLEATVASLIATVKEQASQIQKVSAQLEVNKSAPQTVENN